MVVMVMVMMMMMMMVVGCSACYVHLTLIILSRVGGLRVTYETGSGLDDWFY
jgi:hypothetical protein